MSHQRTALPWSMLDVRTASNPPIREWVRGFWHNHAIALLWYVLLSIVLSWPLITHFTTHLPGFGADPYHNLWLLWHTKEALLKGQSPFYAPLLYYPKGASLLTHGLGPVVGIFALPFWPLGPEAAHNGALLMSLTLTGYCMYLLARGLGFSRGLAMFAGTMLLASPVCLVGIYGHMTKVFLGGLPLVLLALIRALDLERSRWWTMLAALSLLGVLLHSGYQFVFAGLASGFFLAYRWVEVIRTAPANWWPLARRSLLLAFWSLVLVGPLLGATVITANDPALKVDANALSLHYQIDATLFVLPPHFSQVFGYITRPLFEAYDTHSRIDSAFSLIWSGMALCVVAATCRHRQQARPWLLWTLCCLILALGPQLQLGGQTRFTEYELPIILPYAFFTALPGMDFIRLSGRFMMIGSVTFAAAATFGLAALLRQRTIYQRRLLLLLATCLVLIETWPEPWPMYTLRPVPAFYYQLAQDEETYGVVDLPLNPRTDNPIFHVGPSSIYQTYQLVHHKGIVAGYLSRMYNPHPLFPELMTGLEYGSSQSDVQVNGKPAGPYRNIEQKLARYDYRYVVWHKTLFAGSDGQRAAQNFLDTVFGEHPPLIDDAMVRVYAIDPDPLVPTLALGDNWSRREAQWRWATSPATLEITSPQTQQAWLDITPATIYDPQVAGDFGNWAMLNVQAGARSSTVEIIADRTTTLPLLLPEGTQTITLSLPAGNFQAPDGRLLSFAIRSINLRTSDPGPQSGDLSNDAPDASEQQR